MSSTYATNPEWMVAHVLRDGWTLCGRRPGILWRLTRTTPRGSNLCGQCYVAQQHESRMAEQVVI